MIKILTLPLFLVALAFSAASQTTLHLPTMEGTPDDDAAPEGWTIHEPSPDIIEGNGPWPMGTYTVTDVNGGTVAGKTMGLFLSATMTTLEGWQTTFTNLKKGEKYSFAFQWQQATLLSGTDIWYQGGQLLVMVNGDSTIFKPQGDVNDDWQIAKIDFTAAAESATVIIKIYTPEGTYSGIYGGAIVVDNVCQECHEAGMW